MDPPEPQSYPPVGFIRELLRSKPYHFMDSHVELPSIHYNPSIPSEQEDEVYRLIDAQMNDFLDSVTAEMDAEVNLNTIDEYEEMYTPVIPISKLDNTDVPAVNECGEGFMTAKPSPIVEKEVKECVSDTVTDHLFIESTEVKEYIPKNPVSDYLFTESTEIIEYIPMNPLTDHLFTESTEVKEEIPKNPEVELVALQASKPKVTDSNKFTSEKSVQPTKEAAVQPVASSTVGVGLKSGSSESPRNIDRKNIKAYGKDKALPEMNLGVISRASQNNTTKEMLIVKTKAFQLDSDEDSVDEFPELQPAGKKFRMPFRPNTERLSTYTDPTTSKIIESPSVEDLIHHITISTNNIQFIPSLDTLVKNETDTVLENKCEDGLLSEKTKKESRKEKTKLSKQIIQQLSEKHQEPEKLIESITAVENSELKTQTPASGSDEITTNTQAETSVENPKGEKSINTEQETRSSQSPKPRKFDHKTIPVWMKKRKMGHQKQQKEAKGEFEPECECQKRSGMGHGLGFVEEVELIIIQKLPEDESNPNVDQPLAIANPTAEATSPRKSDKNPRKVAQKDVSGLDCCPICMRAALSIAFCGENENNEDILCIGGQDDENDVEFWINSNGEVRIIEGLKTGDRRRLRNQETATEEDAAQAQPPPPPETAKSLFHAKKLVQLIQPTPVSPIVRESADTGENNEEEKLIKPSTK